MASSSTTAAAAATTDPDDPANTATANTSLLSPSNDHHVEEARSIALPDALHAKPAITGTGSIFTENLPPTTLYSPLNSSGDGAHPTADADGAPPGGGKKGMSTKKKIMIGVLLLLLLGLILGLALGLTIGRNNSSSDNNNDPPRAGGPKFEKPKNLAVTPPTLPPPRGYITPPNTRPDPSWDQAYQKALTLLSNLTLVEKINITTGTGWSMGPCVGNTGIGGSHFPSLCLQDGPLGIRYTSPITAFPAGLTTAATWNKDLMLRRGEAMGREARLLGINALLGPCIGPLGRSPLGGRNWEGFGADPYLQGIAGGLTVRGIQGMGVIAVPKHFILNEQERFRRGDELGSEGGPGGKYEGVIGSSSSNIGERALRELYLWPWVDVLMKEGAGGVMCGYNMVNNSYACENGWYLGSVLKGELGFRGFVVSDWLAQRDGLESAKAGMDMTMPGDGLVWSDGKSLWGGELTASILNGTIPLSRLNDMVLRIMAAYFKLGQDNPPPADLPFPKAPTFSSWYTSRIGPKYFGASSSDETRHIGNNHTDPRQGPTWDHAKLAREIAEEGIVMVRNMNLTLPLVPLKGGGQFREGPFKTLGVFGTSAGPAPGGANGCSDRGCNIGHLAQGWGSGSVEYPYLVTPLEAIQARAVKDGTTVNFVLEDGATRRVNETAELVGARGIDDGACLVFVTSDSGENYIHSEGHEGDRKDLNLWHEGDELILAVARRCQNTVVVVNAVGPVIMEKWINHPNVKSVLLAHLPGQESGNALVSILFGDVSPSGHLPYTIGTSLTSYGPSAPIAPLPDWEIPQINYDEGIYIDYRHFDKFNITPRFEFGYGLTYTGWKFEGLTIENVYPGGLVEEVPPEDGGEGGVAPSTNSTQGGGEEEEMDKLVVGDLKQYQFPEGWKSVERFVYPYLPTGVAISPPTTTTTTTATTATTTSPPPPPHPTALPPSIHDPILHITVTITNIGLYPSKLTSQLYLSYPNTTIPALDLPVRVLRGFEKSEFLPGESKRVEFVVDRRGLMVWWEGRWRMPPRAGGGWGGRYGVYVGPSSRGGERGEGVVAWTEVVGGG